MHILVAEDEPLLRSVCEEYFEDLGHTVLGAGDGLAALDLLRSVRVDLLMTDLHMPRMNGVQLLGVVVDEFPRVFCIVASAFAPETVAREMARLGDHAIGFLQKPYAFDMLARMLAEAERRMGLERTA